MNLKKIKLNSKSISVIGLGVAIIGCGVSIIELSHGIFTNMEKLEVNPRSRFFCELKEDRQKGGDRWTVMYREGIGKATPWLRMVRSMGDDWDTKRRCEVVANRMDGYRKDGLLRFDYREDPDVPTQWVICAKTKLSGNTCPIVITLAPEDNIHDVFQEVVGALSPANGPSYQCSNEKICSDSEAFSIDLTKYLAEEDL